MQHTLTIARRQFRAYFDGPVAYIVVCTALLILGAFFWNTFFLFGRATAREMFNFLPIIMILGAPAMTMNLLAEEKRTGTIELLATMPIRDSAIIIGKFLGVLGLYAVMLALTLTYPYSVARLGDLDWGPVITGYLGLLLQGGAMLALCLLASSWTQNQIVAYFVGASLCFGFWIIDRFIVFMPAGVASVFEWLSFDYHFQSMARGVIDTRDVVYFLSVIGLALGLAFRSLESRRWS